MREWLSGGAPPCQGGGRGFDPRLALAGGFRIACDGRFGAFFFFAITHRKCTGGTFSSLPQHTKRVAGGMFYRWNLSRPRKFPADF